MEWKIFARTSLREIKYNRKLITLSPLKVVAVAYECSKYSDLTEKPYGILYLELVAERGSRNWTFDCICHIKIVT